MSFYINLPIISIVFTYEQANLFIFNACVGFVKEVGCSGVSELSVYF